jgi:cobalamin biosynthetic protein CobC
MQHGGDLTEAMARFGGRPADWLDLSTGINPSAYPLPALAPDLATRLPSSADLARLIAVARVAYRVPDAADLVAASGTSALIALLPRLLPPGPVAIVGPTYGEHALAWRAAGCPVVDVPAGGDLPDGARHAVLVHPNNPDGRLAPADEVRRLADAVARRGGVVLVDESFVDVAPSATHVGLCQSHPVVVLRSFGKFYGLAGVRLGFAVGAPALVAALRAALGPWAVSGWALAIGAAALGDGGWSEAMRARLRADADRLDGVLEAGGLTRVGGTSLYRLARHTRARALHAALAEHRIWVRRFDWADDLLRFGLPPTPEALERLRTALAHG